MAYGPNEGDGEERERFWNDIEGIVDRVGNVYRLCVVEDLNGWIEDRGVSCFLGCSLYIWME